MHAAAAAAAAQTISPASRATVGRRPLACARPPARKRVAVAQPARAPGHHARRIIGLTAPLSPSHVYITRSSLSLCVRACPVGSPTPVYILHAPPNVGSFDPKASSPPGTLTTCMHAARFDSRTAAGKRQFTHVRDICGLNSRKKETRKTKKKRAANGGSVQPPTYTAPETSSFQLRLQLQLPNVTA